VPTAQKLLRATVSAQAPLTNENVFFRAETKIYFRPISSTVSQLIVGRVEVELDQWH